MSIKNNTTSLQEVLEILSTKASGGEQETPEISVSSDGLITATAGTKTSTHQLAFQSAKTITPSATSQIAVSSGYYIGGDITVAGDSNLVAENIKSGVSIFGVEGKIEIDENNIDTFDATATAEDILLDKTAYANGNKITGTFTLEEELAEQDALLLELTAILNRSASKTEVWALTLTDGSTIEKEVSLYDN